MRKAWSLVKVDKNREWLVWTWKEEILLSEKERQSGSGRRCMLILLSQRLREGKTSVY